MPSAFSREPAGDKQYINLYNWHREKKCIYRNCMSGRVIVHVCVYLYQWVLQFPEMFALSYLSVRMPRI